MLNNSALRVEWDSDNFKEVEESKKMYQQARKEGRRITDNGGSNILYFKPDMECIVIEEVALKAAQFAFQIFNEHGDERLIWDSTDASEVKEAAERFNKHIEGGGRAYAVSRDGSTRQRMFSFSAMKEEILLGEKKDIRMSFKKFVESFREVRMLAKTTPG